MLIKLASKLNIYIEVSYFEEEIKVMFNCAEWGDTSITSLNPQSNTTSTGNVFITLAHLPPGEC